MLIYIQSMRLNNYYLPLSSKERIAFANKAKTSVAYIEIHLLAKNKRRHQPSEKFLKCLAKASKKAMSLKDLKKYFNEFQEPD